MTEAWKPEKTDLIISAIITLVFPLFAGLLFDTIGALIPMTLYYGIAWGLCMFRRGGSGYHLKKLKRPPVSFWAHMALMLIILILAYLSRITVEHPAVPAVIFTALVWATANASSEQLLWIYLFDSWDLYGKEHFNTRGRILMRLMGILMFTVFVGTIHTMYWAKFLHTVDPSLTVGKIFIIGTTISGYLHIIVWRQSKEMFYTFLPHFVLNLFPLFWTGYSIFPYLLK